jgi:hypothetical protein
MLEESGYLYAVVFLARRRVQPLQRRSRPDILLLDKNLARASESVLFVKVEADWF